MKLTKYQHACVVLEEQGKKLVIDPGEFTPDFGEVDNIVGVVITHVHGDHVAAEHIKQIVAANPNVKIFTTQEVADDLKDSHAQVVKTGEEQTADPFKLRFYGETHKAVHSEWQPCQNIGVLVNDTFYYPGDSLTAVDRTVKVLALPASAPWLRTGEAMDFLKATNPEVFFRTHDGLYNDKGLATTDHWYNQASQKFGPKYQALNPGDSITV